MNANHDDDELPRLPTEAAVQSASTVSRTCFNVFQLGTSRATNDRPTQLPKPLAIDQALCRVSWAPLKFFSAIDARSIDQTNGAKLPANRISVLIAPSCGRIQQSRVNDNAHNVSE